jgi:transposase
MPKSPGLTKLEQGKILAYSSANMSIRDIAKAVGHSKSVVHAFLKNLKGYGTKKSPGRPRLLKIHDRIRLRRYAATGEYTANQLHQELSIDAGICAVQRELQWCDYLAFEKANKPPCMTTHHKMMRMAWVERQIRLRTDWSRVVFSDEKKFNLDGPDDCKYYWQDLRNDKKITWSRHSGGVMGPHGHYMEVDVCGTQYFAVHHG